MNRRCKEYVRYYLMFVVGWFVALNALKGIGTYSGGLTNLIIVSLVMAVPGTFGLAALKR